MGTDKPLSEKDLQKFMLQVSKLDTLEFLGLVKILGIKIFEDNEEKEPRTFEAILSDIFDTYIAMDRKKRRLIMKTVKLSNLAKIEG